MFKKNNSYIIFALPAVILFFVIIVFPTFLTFIFSFTEWRRFKVTGFGTLKHYVRMVGDLTLGKAFKNNFLYIFYTIFLEVGVGLILAWIANRLKRSLLYRSLLFSPVILPSIVVGVLWRQIYAFDSGLLNTVFELLGWEQVGWLGQPYTMLSVSIVSGWIWSGFFMTIFYSGLSRIPETFIESARLDGAGSFRIFLCIELPLIKNLLVLALLIVTTGGFKGFDLFQILLRRDPMESGIVLPTFLVRTFFENRDIGYGSAISMVLTAVVILIMIIINLVNKKYVGAVEEY